VWEVVSLIHEPLVDLASFAFLNYVFDYDLLYLSFNFFVNSYWGIAYFREAQQIKPLASIYQPEAALVLDEGFVLSLAFEA